MEDINKTKKKMEAAAEKVRKADKLYRKAFDTLYKAEEVFKAAVRDYMKIKFGD